MKEVHRKLNVAVNERSLSNLYYRILDLKTTPPLSLLPSTKIFEFSANHVEAIDEEMNEQKNEVRADLFGNFEYDFGSGTSTSSRAKCLGLAYELTSVGGVPR